jgi:hypothetical protein
MLFKVSPDLRGSLVLSTIGKVLYANGQVDISGDDLQAIDVKTAIKTKVLILVDDKKENKDKLKDSRVLVVNKVNRTLVFESTRIGPLGSALVSEDFVKYDFIKLAQEKGIIDLVFPDKGEKAPSKAKALKNAAKVEKKIKEDEKIMELEKIQKGQEETKTTPVTWDFKKQEAVEAEQVPTSHVVREVEEEDNDKKKKKSVKKKKKSKKKKKTTRKKATKKKTTKKKVISSKSKNKAIEPVGEVKEEVTSAEVAIEMDSRGNPVEKPSNTLQHLIDSIEDDMGFVDQEQTQEIVEKRTQDTSDDFDSIEF